MNVLKPCPFCGLSDSIGLEWEIKCDYYVECGNCWARGPESRDGKIAIAMWNDRGKKRPEGSYQGPWNVKGSANEAPED